MIFLLQVYNHFNNYLFNSVIHNSSILILIPRFLLGCNKVLNFFYFGQLIKISCSIFSSLWNLKFYWYALNITLLSLFSFYLVFIFLYWYLKYYVCLFSMVLFFIVWVYFGLDKMYWLSLYSCCLCVFYLFWMYRNSLIFFYENLKYILKWFIFILVTNFFTNTHHIPKRMYFPYKTYS